MYSREIIQTRLETILTKNDMIRIMITNGNQEITITVDVHGLKCQQAKKLIRNIINIASTSFSLVIIHGYNHGTAIKNMLSDNFANSHITSRYIDPFNQGVTHMQIAA